MRHLKELKAHIIECSLVSDFDIVEKFGLPFLLKPRLGLVQKEL